MKADITKLKAVVDLFASLAVGVACVVLIWSMLSNGRRQPEMVRQDAPPRVETITGVTIPLQGRAIGSRGARLAVIEFSDFQCPFCGKYARDTFPRLKSEFVDTGQVAYAFMNLPLEEIHPLAKRAAVAAECAREQNKFLEMHAALFGDQRKLQDPDLFASAKRLELDEGRLSVCMDSTGISVVKRDASLAKKLNITSTPVFLIGIRGADDVVDVTRRISGAQGIAAFKDVLNELSQLTTTAALTK